MYSKCKSLFSLFGDYINRIFLEHPKDQTLHLKDAILEDLFHFTQISCILACCLTTVGIDVVEKKIYYVVRLQLAHTKINLSRIRLWPASPKRLFSCQIYMLNLKHFRYRTILKTKIFCLYKGKLHFLMFKGGTKHIC